MSHKSRTSKRASKVIGTWTYDEITGYSTLKPSTRGTRYATYFAVPTEVDGIVVAEIYGDADRNGSKSPGDSYTGTLNNLTSFETSSSDPFGTFSHYLGSGNLYTFTGGEVSGKSNGLTSIWTNI